MPLPSCNSTKVSEDVSAQSSQHVATAGDDGAEHCITLTVQHTCGDAVSLPLQHPLRAIKAKSSPKIPDVTVIKASVASRQQPGPAESHKLSASCHACSSAVYRLCLPARAAAPSEEGQHAILDVTHALLLHSHKPVGEQQLPQQQGNGDGCGTGVELLTLFAEQRVCRRAYAWVSSLVLSPGAVAVCLPASGLLRSPNSASEYACAMWTEDTCCGANIARPQAAPPRASLWTCASTSDPGLWILAHPPRSRSAAAMLAHQQSLLSQEPRSQRALGRRDSP